MASSGNFATWNPLARTNPSLSYAGSTFLQGNTKFAGTTGGNSVGMSTLYMTSGKWYAEFYQSGSPAGGWPAYGIIKAENATEAQNVSNIQNKTYESHITHTGYHSKFGDTNSGTNTGDTFTAGDIIQIAVDIDAGKAWWGKNNTWTQSGDPANGNNPNDTFTAGTEITFYTSAYNGCGYIIINAGQDDTFGGAITAAGNADGNGFGVFKYAPPTGFLAPCSGNLSVSDDIDPAQTDDDYPSKQFGIGLYTGQSGGGNSVVCGFQPDLIWGKLRSGSQTGILIDSSRGQGILFSAITNAEQTSNGPFISSYNSDGFTFGSSGSNPNDNGGSYVAWCWRANGGTTTSDSSGDITVTRQTNDAAKFSILTYTGSGSSGNTIAHGLGVKPAMTIIKQRNSSNGWNVWHQGYNNGDYDSFGELNSSAAWNANQGSNGPFSAAPGTDYLTLTAYGQVNGSSNTYVCYTWADVEGMQKFGSYEGNGNADGPFIYTGFRPRLLFMKNADTSGRRWTILDSARNTSNLVDSVVNWDESQAEYDSSARGVDILSNGFKIRGTDSDNNTSGNTYVFGAWGDVPFKYNNTF